MALNPQTIVLTVKKHPLGVAASALALIMAVGIYVRSGDFETLTTELAAQTEQGERLNNNLKNSAELDEQLRVVTAATEEVMNRAINPSSLATNLQYFYRLESELGLKLIDLRQGVAPALAAGAHYVGVPYNLSVQGTYPQLLNFIRRLETGSHLIKFLATNMSPSRSVDTRAQDPTNPVLVLNLNIEVLGK